MMIAITYRFVLLYSIYSISCQCLKCYECSEYIPCGQEQMNLMVDCAGKCMVYRNEFDSNRVIRRCCTSGCGPSYSVSEYEGRTTYFCSTDLCNKVGSETILPDGITFSSTTARITSLSSPPSTTTTTVTGQLSLQCYDCSEIDCGREGSPITINCPMCMIYRNPNDQTKIERRCCRQNCGSSFSIKMYNGIQTYFCGYDKCNKYGAETILNPPVIKSTISSTTTTTMITQTTSSPRICTLNCRNGGTLDRDGCFCYCVEKTNGSECEYIDCTKPDDNEPGICLPENQSLCRQSDIFTFKCLRLCGKC